MMNAATRRTDADRAELALIERASRGDRDAFGEWFTLRWGWACRWARRWVRDPLDAEDVAMIAFEHAWRAVGRWRGGRNTPEAWLATIIRNACHDHGRRQQTRPRTVGWNPGIDDDTKGDRDDDQPEAVVVADDQARFVLAAVAALPADQRTVIWLAARHDMTAQQIARRLGIPRSTVKSRLLRGRWALRQRISVPAVAPRRPHGLSWTLAEDQQAVDLRASGAQWDQIAEQMGRSRDSCRRAVARVARVKERMIA